MDIRHLRLREEGDKYLVKTAVAVCHRCDIEVLGLFLGILCHSTPFTASVLDLVQELIQVFDQLAGIPVGGIPIFDLFHLIGDEVLHFQHMCHQFHMGDIVRM